MLPRLKLKILVRLGTKMQALRKTTVKNFGKLVVWKMHVQENANNTV